MPEPLYVLVNFVLVFIDVISWCMCIRAILSWISNGEGRLIRFLYTITEPAIMPMRKLFHKLNWFQGMPIDMAYMFTYVTLFLVQLLLRSFL